MSTKKRLYLYSHGRKMFSWKCVRRRRAWNMIPFVVMWVVWSERNRRAIEGVESSFSQLRSSLCSLIFFWYTQKVPCCIDDWVELVENHIFCNSLLFAISLVYGHCGHVYKRKYIYLIKKKTNLRPSSFGVKTIALVVLPLIHP